MASVISARIKALCNELDVCHNPRADHRGQEEPRKNQRRMVLRFLSRSCAYAQVVTSSSICVLKGEMILARSASSFVDHVINAGRLVGYPPSLLNLKHLFGEEMSYLASHLKRLIGSKHPVVTTAR